MYFTTTRLHKGNVDLQKLEDLIKKVGRSKIPYVSVAARVNMAGGQPISMENMKRFRELTKKYGIRIILDPTRAVENAYFLKVREKAYENKSVAEILFEFCSYSNGCTMSGKKDLLVNIGSFLAVNEKELYEETSNLVIVYEGLHTYGGLAGRDMEAMARGIEEAVQEDHIRAPVGQVEYVGKKLTDSGIPIVVPIGGHAIFLDAKRFLPHIPQIQFPASALAAEIYIDSGVRSMERGIVSAGRNKETSDHYYPKLELVLLTFPRRVYTQAHCDVTVESIQEVWEKRDSIGGLRMVYEPKYLRFFQARFERP